MRLKLICCDVFAREIGGLLPTPPHALAVKFFSKGLHETGCAVMRAELQKEIDRTSARDFDAILLGYGLCGCGAAGLHARDLPLVIPRAHDCIGVLLGSRARHEAKLAEHPGVYFRSSGWLERTRNPEHLKALSFAERNSLNSSRGDLIAGYGAEGGEFLAGILCEQTRHYDRLALIETGVEPDDRFERASRLEANQRGWTFEKLRGDLTLLRKLLLGQWDEAEFLVVQPGQTIQPTYDERLFASVSVQDPFTA